MRKLKLITKLNSIRRTILLRLIMNKSQWNAYKSWMKHADPYRLGEVVSLDYNRYNEMYNIHMSEIREQAISSNNYSSKSYKIRLNSLESDNKNEVISNES